MDFPKINKMKSCRYGDMLFHINDAWIGRSLDHYGEWSDYEMRLLAQFLAAGDTALDIGANIGTHSVFFARQVGAKGRVLAFEPQRVLFQTLCANLAINSITNVSTYQQAVGESAGKIVVPKLDFTNEMNFASLSLGAHKDGEEVPLITVDSLALTTCRLIKIDVEGMELGVLKGATQTINRTRPVLYVENDRLKDMAQVPALLESLGYRIYWHIPPYYLSDNFAGNPENIFAGCFALNLLCLHRRDVRPLANLINAKQALEAIKAHAGKSELLVTYEASQIDQILTLYLNQPKPTIAKAQQ